MKKYTEKEKNIARESVIKDAIKCLTTEREESTIASKDYVRKIHTFLTTHGTKYDKQNASKLTMQTINRWEEFYQSIVQTRYAKNLKVAYLSGPNPENDLEVMFQNGILPENVWAFESDKNIYNEAIISALNSKFPFIKIIKGNISQFFLVSQQKFDIIYLDFCGPLPSRNKEKTLSTLTSLISGHVFNSPGVLITNFSLPTIDQDKKGNDFLKKMTALYLYPKAFLENKSQPEHNLKDGPITYGLEFDQFLELVEQDLEEYYGQFITRLIIDYSAIISIYDNFPQKNHLFEQFFTINSKENLKEKINSLYHFNDEDDGGDIIVDPNMMPILWSIACMDKSRNASDDNYPNLVYKDDEFYNFCTSFISQLSHEKNHPSVIQNVELLHFLLTEGTGVDEFYNDTFIELSRRDWIREMYNFCDLVLFHQIKELLFRQLAVPYDTNIKKCKRWTYKAKSTRMFMDMTILDECRYVYDWMPTLDMINNGFNNIERQLSYRFALDALAKNRLRYNNEYFFGTSVVGINQGGFDASILD